MERAGAGGEEARAQAGASGGDVRAGWRASAGGGEARAVWWAGAVCGGRRFFFFACIYISLIYGMKEEIKARRYI